ncbi:response regulator [Patescibacteria group bacterium]|nr:response regulator [Patescibacteria group bacterium]
MKVLVIDDDKFVQKVYQVKLEEAGYEVIQAFDGQEGEEKISKEKPDFILLDMIMPKKNGFELLEDIKTDAKLKKVPVVVISNLKQDSDIEKAKNLGANEYMPKDQFSPVQIIEKIKEIVGK